MWTNFLCSTVLLSVSYTTAFPFYAQPPGKFDLGSSQFQPLHFPWWYEPRLMLPPSLYMPSVFSRCLAAIPKMLTLPLMTPHYLMLHQQRYDDPPPCAFEPNYVLRIYVPERVDQNKSDNVLQQIEESTPTEATTEAPIPQGPAEGPAENAVAEDANAVFQTTQEPGSTVSETVAVPTAEPSQTIPTEVTTIESFTTPEDVLKVTEVTETPDVIEDQVISQTEEGKPIEEDENAPGLVKDTQGNTDELKAAENEIEDVKTQEMEKEEKKEDKIDEANAKVDILKANLYQTSDPDQSLTSNSV